MGKSRRFQPDLDLRCVECGKYLEPTPSGYLACPRGHGTLRAAEEVLELPYEGQAMFPDDMEVA